VINIDGHKFEKLFKPFFSLLFKNVDYNYNSGVDFIVNGIKIEIKLIDLTKNHQKTKRIIFRSIDFDYLILGILKTKSLKILILEYKRIKNLLYSYTTDKYNRRKIPLLKLMLKNYRNLNLIDLIELLIKN